MSSDDKLRVKFWGVRGSIPTPRACNLGYGGNTTCVEFRIGNQTPLVIDAGSGIVPLGEALDEEFGPASFRVDILFTHFHWDHIQGLPFLAGLYREQGQCELYSTLPADELRHVLEGQMASPYFPAQVPTPPRVRCHEVPVDGYRNALLTAKPFPLRHPDPTSGYRIETARGVVVHASDHEHGDAEYDRVLRENAAGADILIYDAQYTLEEYEARRGWGHGTWVEATHVARDAGVKQLVLFHHDPSHDDDFIDDLVEKARAEFPNTIAAREGESLVL